MAESLAAANLTKDLMRMKARMLHPTLLSTKCQDVPSQSYVEIDSNQQPHVLGHVYVWRRAFTERSPLVHCCKIRKEGWEVNEAHYAQRLTDLQKHDTVPKTLPQAAARRIFTQVSRAMPAPGKD